jgi:hypothetical protein
MGYTACGYGADVGDIGEIKGITWSPSKPFKGVGN